MENVKTAKRKGRIVRKIYALENVAGLVSRSKAHKTKSMVSLYNVAQAGLSTDESFVWSVVCDSHHTMTGTATLPLAKVLLSDPDAFCEECRASLEVKEPVEALFEIQEPVAAVG